MPDALPTVAPTGPGWAPIETAAKVVGQPVDLWIVHANAAYSADPVGEGWAACSQDSPSPAYWSDFNGGGWTWYGLCGRVAHWRPRRIQLRRTKGWRMPAGAVKVDRTTRWGNPFRVGDCAHVVAGGPVAVCFTAETAVDAFRTFCEHPIGVDFVAMVRSELRGKTLACWCAPGAPCHADVLLELANGPLSTLSPDGGEAKDAAGGRGAS